MILNILNDSVRYTFSNPKTFAKIMLCELCSMFIVPRLFICGFQYEIIEDSLQQVIFEESNLPQTDNFKNLLKKGIKLFLVKIAYLSIPIILSSMIIFGLIPLLTGSIINLLIFITLYIYCFIAIANMIYHKSFKKAFSIREIILVKNNIHTFILFGLIAAILFVFYGMTTFLEDCIVFLGEFININKILFSQMSIYKLLVIIILSMTVIPFIDILTARITGIIYYNKGDL